MDDVLLELAIGDAEHKAKVAEASARCGQFGVQSRLHPTKQSGELRQYLQKRKFWKVNTKSIRLSWD